MNLGENVAVMNRDLPINQEVGGGPGMSRNGLPEVNGGKSHLEKQYNA